MRKELYSEIFGGFLQCSSGAKLCNKVLPLPLSVLRSPRGSASAMLQFSLEGVQHDGWSLCERSLTNTRHEQRIGTSTCMFQQQQAGFRSNWPRNGRAEREKLLLQQCSSNAGSTYTTAMHLHTCNTSMPVSARALCMSSFCLILLCSHTLCTAQ